jgi:hypothetical protein
MVFRRRIGKLTANVPKDGARAVWVRLPETISFKACSKWAQQYIAGHPNGPVDLLVLYQPTVADTANGQTAIDHGYFTCGTLGYTAWTRPERHFSIEALVGIISNGTSRRLQSAGTLSAAAPNIDEMYVYQHGEYFTVFEQKPNGTVEGHLDNLASGVIRHAVLKMANGDEMALSGIFRPKKMLSLFD